MRKSLLHAMLFAALCLVSAPDAARAQTVYGYSEVGYNSDARYVYGYSATWTDYYAAWYYDPEVHALLLRLPEAEIPLDEGHAIGYSDPGGGYQMAAEVYNESGAYSPATTYEEYSTHIVRPYYSYSYCFDCWYDPYGFSFWGNSFTGTGSYNYGWPSYFYDPYYYVSGQPQVFGRIAVRITTPADPCSPGTFFNESANTCVEPTPTPPPPQCPSGQLVITDRRNTNINDEKPNAMPGATVDLAAMVHGPEAAGTYTWEFADLPSKINPGESNWTDNVEAAWEREGEKQVKVTFTLGSNASCTYSAKTTVNVTFPTVSELSGNQKATRVINKGGPECIAQSGQPLHQPNFGVGCIPGTRPATDDDVGIKFNAMVEAPERYISRPAESQVRWVQRFNEYTRGLFACGDRTVTWRNPHTELSTGWRLDNKDPYPNLIQYPTHHPSFDDAADKSTLEFETHDTPNTPILDFEGQLGLVSDTRFEMHLIYTGGAGNVKRVEKSLGFVPWKVPGRVTLDSATQTYRLDPASAEPAGLKPGTIKVDNVPPYGAYIEPKYPACPNSNPPTLPSPQTSGDIGAVGFEGSASYDSGTYTVAGSGADIWNDSDAFRYVSETLTGDGEIVARVAGVDYTDGWAKAGVMLRESLAANSRHASMFVTPGNGTAFQWRTDPGYGTSHLGYYAAPPSWVKLVRQGNTFTGYTSADGSSWVYVGAATFYMPETVYVGMAVTSHNNGALCRATFDNVSINPLGASCNPAQELNCYNQGGNWDPSACQCYLPEPDPCLGSELRRPEPCGFPDKP